MKYILTLACAVLTACGQSAPLVDILPTGHYPTNLLGEIRSVRPIFVAASLWAGDGTNVCDVAIVTNVVTQWLPIEREEGQRGARVKQIGILVTNQVLTVIAYDKTNEVILKVLGREEWPSQKRVIVVPNTTGGPALTKGR